MNRLHIAIILATLVAALTFGIAFFLRRTGREAQARPASKPGGET